MYKKTSAAVLISAILAVGCGGSGGSDSGSGSNGGGGVTPQSATVSGPLDTVQSAVTNQVVAPLAAATAGTPLQGVIQCGNSVVTQNVLDVGDSIANALANPTSLTSLSAANAQAAVQALISNLSGLLFSLANTGSTTACSGLANGTSGVPATNPLAGTPLAALGDALLPALTSGAQQLQGAAPGSLSITQLQGIVDMLSSAFGTGFGQLSPGTQGAPVVGGVVAAVGNALASLQTIVDGIVAGQDPTAVAGNLQNLAQTSLVGMLTQLVPVASLQSLAPSGSTDVLGQLQSAIASLTSTLGTSPTSALPSNPLSGAGFSSLFDLLGTLNGQFPSVLSGTTGTPLDTALVQIQNLLTSLLTPVSGGSSGGGSSTCTLNLLGLLCL